MFNRLDLLNLKCSRPLGPMDMHIQCLKSGELGARRTQYDELRIGLDNSPGDSSLYIGIRQVESRSQVKRVSLYEPISVTYLDHSLWRVDFRDVHASEYRRQHFQVSHVSILSHLGSFCVVRWPDRWAALIALWSCPNRCGGSVIKLRLS